jgi:hypothetical protein
MSHTPHALRESRQDSIPVRSRPRRLVEGFAFIAAWVGLGYLFPGSAEAYLLMGIPLTTVFQVLVRRRPLRELWVREGGAGSGLSSLRNRGPLRRRRPDELVVEPARRGSCLVLWRDYRAGATYKVASAWWRDSLTRRS